MNPWEGMGQVGLLETMPELSLNGKELCSKEVVSEHDKTQILEVHDAYILQALHVYYMYTTSTPTLMENK